jgi:mono/diheme cytochrome c family protein/cytochrome c553
VLTDGVLLSTFREARVIKVADDGAVSSQPSPPIVRLVQTFDGGVMTVPDGFDAGTQFTPRVAWRMVSGSNATVMVHQRSQISPITGSCEGSSYGGKGQVGTVHSVVEQVTPIGTMVVGLALKAVLPVDVAVSADGTRMAIAAAGSGVHTWQQAFSSSGFVPNHPGIHATAVLYRNDTLVAFTREPAMLHLISPSNTFQTLTLNTVNVASTGHELFHRPTASQIACASCHPEAGEDGHVWNLPEGPRRTPTLRGGLTSTAPFHWSGDQATIGSLMSDVLVKRMGGVPQSPARADATLRWLDGQPALPAPSGLDAPAIARGSLLFSGAAGCASCHSGALGTNNANANVGTGALFQVPRLVELAHRAPYFHDGRIQTMPERFTAAGGGNLHGATSQLSSAEVADLVAYLLSR